MRRRLFTLATAMSSLLCMGTVALWIHGGGRTAGWYFKPSPAFAIQQPDPDLPSQWWVQWQIGWGGVLSVDRQVKPVNQNPRIGFYSFQSTRQWNPLPKSERVHDPRIAAQLRMLPGNGIVPAYRTKPATAWSHLGITYVFHEQESGKYPKHNLYFASDGELFLRVPLLYPFILFAILPGLQGFRVCRAGRRRAGHCPTCGYNLTGNASGVCPECGSTALTLKVPA